MVVENMDIANPGPHNADSRQPKLAEISEAAYYQATDLDGRAYQRTCIICAALLLGVYGLAIAQMLPLLTLPLAVLLILPRWMISLHELLHLYSSEDINPYIGLMGVSPVPLSLISLSYGPIRTLHFAHHAAPATQQDPDAFHICGSWAKVTLNAFLSPEKSTLYWVKGHGLSPKMTLEWLLKLMFLAFLAKVGGLAFLWLWVSLRLVYGLGDLAFFRLVHHRQGEYGTYALPLPLWLERIGEGIWGKTVIQATLHHDIHHRDPRVAAGFLAAKAKN